MANDLKDLLQREITGRGLPMDFLNTVETSYMPVAEFISKKWHNKQQTLLISFNGAQGSGKSTFTAFLRLILTHHFNLFTVEVSIDDFYLKKSDRTALGKSIHPLFETRGVPGTHDIPLAIKTLKCLKDCRQDISCKIPVFNKAIDDRAEDFDWPEVAKEVNIVLFEGWCNHAPVQTDDELLKPINELESVEDSDGVWRNYANDQLKRYHELIFSSADALVYLQVPSFEKVYEWRGLQEQKLAKKQKKNVNSKIMNEPQLKRFIQHYERITRSCLKSLPQQADVLLKLNADHGIDEVLIKGQVDTDV